MNRRKFVEMSLGASGSALLGGMPAFATAKVGISRITVLEVPGAFRRPVAMNAYDKGPVGKNGHIRLVRAFLPDGTYGLAVEGYEPFDENSFAFMQKMIGVDPESVFAWHGDRIVGHAPEYTALSNPKNAWFELALLDLVGKLRRKPVHALFGPPKRDGVDVYDGSLYFVDVASGKGAEHVGSVAAEIREDGYRGIKIKVGRPSMWMPGEAGVVRDIEAVIAAREATGSNMNLMADANNGYAGKFEWAMRFLRESSPYRLTWIEEIFPETLADYQSLVTRMRAENATIAIADGESVRDMDAFLPYMQHGLYNYIQPDMRTSGFTTILQAAALAAPFRVNVAPHNWMSELGKIACLHASRICSNIPLVEDDRYSDFSLDTSDFAFRAGQFFVSDKAGWGVDLSPDYEIFKRASQEIVLS